MHTIDETEFSISFFKENDFLRKTCPKCGAHYWTQNRDSKTCGDAPCQEYSFLGKPPTNRSYSVREMRTLFLSYFEKQGHKIINPYPVVARWRDDVFLVGASIYDFQPYVTEGIQPPPANPLVVSQPCLRFTDLDNVGPTAGRHLVIFEMGGAHAFNYPDKKLYWKDETIRYHHELLTRELGVPFSEVTYKEHFWSGGGNAGPDLEACVAGLEVSTLVFMTYKVKENQLIELPIRTVDTGYGIERWAWLSQGSPSGFHAIYGKILPKIFRMADIKPDEKLVREMTIISSLMSVETLGDRREARKKLATTLEIELNRLDEELSKAESAYAVADHTKALAFLLAEGVVPSNVEEGYLARLLARRTFRMLRSLGIEGRLAEIMDMQIEEWGQDFPSVKEMRSEILEALRIEESKYQRTIARGAEIVARIASEYKKKAMPIPQEVLIELYDSHGLVPELVKEFSTLEGYLESGTIEIPSDFYGLVAQRHLAPPVAQEEPKGKLLREKVSQLPTTRTLYYENPYQREFTAKVIATFENQIILDQTAFYPEGGGQPADFGELNWNASTVQVTNCEKIGNVIVHTIQGPALASGTTVTGRIDWTRRRSLMRHHTATHIVLGAARRVLGQHAWQAGAQKDVERTRLDISHYERLTEEQVARIESLACQVVMENIPVEISWMPREAAEATYGYRLYQGGLVPGREIRVVRIGEWDVEACGGTHCERTGEVGVIRIVKTDRVQDGVERLTFSAGEAGVNAIQEQDRTLRTVAQILNTPVERVVDTAGLRVDENRELRKENEILRGRLTGYESRQIMLDISKSDQVGPVSLSTDIKEDADDTYLIRLSEQLVRSDPKRVAVLVSNRKTNARIVVAAGADAVRAGLDSGMLAAHLAKILGGGGGGKPYLGQGGGTDLSKLDTIRAEAKKFLDERLGSK